MISAMKMTAYSLRLMRTDEKFAHIFSETEILCTQLQIDEPALPRIRCPPKRYTGPAEQHIWNSAEEYFKAQYYIVIDTTVQELTRCYDQPDVNKYLVLERALLQCNALQDEMTCASVRQYPELNVDLLTTQLEMFRQQPGWSTDSLSTVCEKLTSTVRQMFNQVSVKFTLVKFTSPATCNRSRCMLPVMMVMVAL
jgi:hypothetical protein